VHEPAIVILDEATSALDSANESSLYKRLRDKGTTLVSVAHRAGVLRHHTHVLWLTGDGGWEVHAAADYQFDVPVPARGSAQEAQAAPQPGASLLVD
jgi:putative ATP-binding cassette transporter